MIVLGVGSAFRNLMHLGTQKSKEYENDYSPQTQVEQLVKANTKVESEELAKSKKEHLLK
ncbi:MAG: hypothetical protein ACD_5C00149G0005, partial [uncultured bacterium]